tara:strand:- start:258 stop:563 length:306 start_codon:yes stop_codon:yes gene_type:complete
MKRKTNRDNRSSYGVVTLTHKGKKISTVVGSKGYENTFCGINPPAVSNHTVGNIPYGYHNRPELIADLFYNTPSSWWRICEVNNIFDVFEQLQSGDQIYLP